MIYATKTLQPGDPVLQRFSLIYMKPAYPDEGLLLQSGQDECPGMLGSITDVHADYLVVCNP